MDGAKLKYDKMRRVRSNAIEYNSVALALPVYRALVSSTTSLLIPHLFQYIKDEESRTGRPGVNRIAIPYITAVGVEKCTAIAVITTINNFHRSLSYQSLSQKIGQYVAAEWSILQEDPEIVERIRIHTHKGASTIRRQIFMRQQLSRILDRPLQSVPQVGKIAIGNIFLSFIERTPLISLTRDNKKGFIVSASTEVITSLDKNLKDSSLSDPISLPSLSPEPADIDSIIKPQAGMDTVLSSTEDGSIFHKACGVLNNTGYTVCEEQLEFLLSLADCPTSVLGIPGHREVELPAYIDGMTDEQRELIRQGRARTYAARNVWKGKRTKLLSSLSLLKQYRNKEVFFSVQADFRGRLYPESDLLSYQGEDWIRSLWKFKTGQPITTKEQADWLYIQAANCYGLSRKTYASRISYISNRMETWRLVVNEPLQYVEVLEEAKDPFRFLAALRELVSYENHGIGYVSHLPIQIDASSQAIQIWAGLTNNRDLLITSNVIHKDNKGSDNCHDIYKNLANEIYHDAMNDAAPGAMHWRLVGIERPIVKKAMMIIPYGGTYIAIQNIVDTTCIDAPFIARRWLCNKLWYNSRDILHDLVIMQEKLTQAVSEYMKDSTKETYDWTSPCGVHIKQRYMKTKKKRIKNVIGQTLYSYRVEMDKVDKRRHATAFPANFLHSLDASLLCYGVSLMSDYGFNQVMPIHDCVGVPAAHVNSVKYFLSVSYLWLIQEGQRLAEGQCNILKLGTGSADPWYHGSTGLKEMPWSLSPYLFS